ncbi:unnamed protein product [Sympodiomycopsis kandeliae]
MSVPQEMKSLRTQADAKIGVETVAVPTPGKNEVLVKVIAVTLNPTDFKSARFISKPGNAVGCDAYGEVVALGSDLNVPLQVGEKIAFFTMGSFHSPRTGSFSEYAIAQSDTSMIVPDGYDGYQASSWGIGGLTAIQTLFDKLELNPIPNDITSLPELKQDSPQLLVWAGSTSVGQFAIQLARVAGYRVITTGSPKNHAYLKSLGADDVYDYRDESTPDKIAQKYPNLYLALDCVSEKGSTVSTAKSLTKSPPSGKKATVSNILPTEQAAKEARPDVDFKVSLAYCLLGVPFTFGKWPLTDAEIKHSNEFIKPWTASKQSITYNLMKQNLVKGNQIRVLGKGVEEIEKGIDLLQNGQGSIEKIAYQI